MGQRAEQQRQQQGAGGPELDGTAPVKNQNQPRQHQRGPRQPVAVAEQALQKPREKVQKQGVNAEVPHKDAQRQHQQHAAGDLPADGLLLRGLFGRFAAGPFGGGFLL